MKISKAIYFFVIWNLLIFNFGYVLAYKDNIDDGIYYIKSVLDTNKCLDITGASREESASLQLYQENCTDAQKFYIHKLKSGYYEIRAACSGKLITCEEGKISANIVQKGYNDSDNQKWSIVRLDDGTIQFVIHGLFLDVDKASTEDGTRIQLWEGNNTNAQKFKLVPIKKFDTSGYTLSDQKENMQIERIKHLLKFLHKNWNSEEVKSIIDNSQICFGVYDKSGVQVGFTRVITDYKTTCFIMNGVIDENCRGKGLNTMLIRYILEHKELANCKTISLIPTSEKVAKGVRLFGFYNTGWNYMLFNRC